MIAVRGKAMLFAVFSGLDHGSEMWMSWSIASECAFFVVFTTPHAGLSAGATSLKAGLLNRTYLAVTAS
jgi:hypothetical protein